MMRLVGSVAILCVFLIPSTADACSCATGDPSVEFGQAKAVFIGTMLGGTERLSVEGRDGKRHAIEAGQLRFSVEEVFKGDVVHEVTVEISSHVGTSCGPYGLERDERYLVYAYSGRTDDGMLSSGVCTRTSLVRGNSPTQDLDFLRNLPPPGQGGQLRGRIWAELGVLPSTPLPGVRVNIRRVDGRIVTANTDRDGKFEVRNLPAGVYQVEPEFPAHYASDGPSAEAVVVDRGTTEVGFRTYINGSVSGRVVDKDGQDFNSVFLHLVGGGRTIYGQSVGERGVVEFKGVPPGEYVLYLEMQNEDRKNNAKFYYPGTFRQEEATAIHVELGQAVDGLQLTLPDDFKVRTVEGQVRWPDGQPAAHVDVMLLCPRSTKPGGYRVEFSPSETTTDDHGRFRLEGFAGETYWIEARGSARDSPPNTIVPVHSTSEKLDLKGSLKDVGLILSRSGLTQGCEK